MHRPSLLPDEIEALVETRMKPLEARARNRSAFRAPPHGRANRGTLMSSMKDTA